MTPEEGIIHKAAASLSAHLFGASKVHPEASIGMGVDKLHVYVHCSKSRWPHDTPGEWDGFPIVWHFNIGTARAY